MQVKSRPVSALPGSSRSWLLNSEHQTRDGLLTHYAGSLHGAPDGATPLTAQQSIWADLPLSRYVGACVGNHHRGRPGITGRIKSSHRPERDYGRWDEMTYADSKGKSINSMRAAHQGDVQPARCPISSPCNRSPLPPGDSSVFPRPSCCWRLVSSSRIL